MNISRKSLTIAAVIGVASTLGCAGLAPATAEVTTASGSTGIASSFEPRGQAGIDRLAQYSMQAACSEYEGKKLPAELAEKITGEAIKAVRFPESGYFGDWKAGEKIAKTGTGLQSSDDPKVANGGNCYACHQLAPAEAAYGTLGPPLSLYGKLRGSNAEMLKYTWTRLWNSHAYNACSHMPRFGDASILTEVQLKDVMAYLFDPASPVNIEAASKP